MNTSVTILGSNSALPAHGRFPSAQLLNIAGHCLLIDCGEGTQFKFNQYKLSKMKVSHIFITHLHGDHVFGLPGLLNSLILLNRKEPLTIAGPIGIKAMMDHIFDATHARFNYEIKYIETDTETHSVILDHPDFTVENIPLNHKVPCNGYLFREKERQKNIYPEIVEKHGLTGPQIIELKEGRPITTEQGLLKPEEALYSKRDPRSYAYCTDTSYLPSIIPIINGVDLLYHEATYQEDFEAQALERGHSTARQAALIAKKANVGALLIGHPSSKYSSIEQLLTEAKSVFYNTRFATEGHTFEI